MKQKRQSAILLRFRLLLLSLSLLLSAFSVNSFSFPQVTGWKNSPLLVFENKQQAVLKKNLFLKSPFAVVTANVDQLDFKVNTLDRVVVYPKSKIQVLEFSEETGFVTELYILDGQIRYTIQPATQNNDNLAGDLAKNAVILALKTPFFDLKTGSEKKESEVDFIINLNMKEPSVEVKVIEGVLPLQFFDYEKKLSLKSGESVKFMGVMSDEANGGGIKYDYLLNKRKVPKGTLGEIQHFDPKLLIKEEKNLEIVAVQKKKKITQKAIDKKRKQKEYEASFLCRNPFAKKDQCAWWLEKASCYRKRCNVNGQWGDFTERPVAAWCKKDFYVNECDY